MVIFRLLIHGAKDDKSEAFWLIKAVLFQDGLFIFNFEEHRE